MSRTIKVKVIEEITETRIIEIEVADGVDLADEDVRRELFENAYVEGDYRTVDGETSIAVTERDFTLLGAPQ